MEKLESSWMRKIAIALCAFAVACCCGLMTGCASENSEDAVRNTVTDELDQIKNSDPELIDEIASQTTEFKELEMYNITAADAYQAMFSDFDYKIEKVEVDGDKATVGIVFTTKDLSKFQNALIEAAQQAQANGEFDNMNQEQANEAIGKMVIDTIKALPVSQTPVTDFQVVKKNGAWEMADDSGTILQEALFPTSVMNR